MSLAKLKKVLKEYNIIKDKLKWVEPLTLVQKENSANPAIAKFDDNGKLTISYAGKGKPDIYIDAANVKDFSSWLHNCLQEN